jgi:hypothetical protein
LKSNTGTIAAAAAAGSRTEYDFYGDLGGFTSNSSAIGNFNNVGSGIFGNNGFP